MNKDALLKLTTPGSSDLNVSFRGIMRFLPLIVVGGFFLTTIALFVFGPVDWRISDPLKLYGFLFACVVALVSGYLAAVLSKRKSIADRPEYPINKILIVGALVFLILYVPTLISTTGNWYPDLLTGFFDTGEAYRNAKYVSENSNQIILYVRMILAPLTIVVVPLTLFFLPKLSKVGKILGFLVIGLTVSISISQGVNKAVADFTAQMVLMLTILLFSNNLKSKNTKAFRLIILTLMVAICTMFLVYFSNGMSNRVTHDIESNAAAASKSDETGSSGATPSKNSKLGQEAAAKASSKESQASKQDPDTKGPSPSKEPQVSEEELNKAMSKYSTFGNGELKEGYFLSGVLPDKAISAAQLLSSYLSHGYKGLSFALEEDFTSTYGLGFSDFFRHNFSKVAGFDEDEIVSRTYYGKIEKEYGWETGNVWSSFFIYPASDISFPGTVILVFAIGFLFGRSWRAALEDCNPYAITVFFGLATMIFYFSANNQMFQGGENFIGFTVVLVTWLLSSFRIRSRKTVSGRP